MSADRAVALPVDNRPGVPKSDPILIADSVRRAFGGLVAVDVDHAEVQRGEITALIGPNGAGKTTFFNLMTGFDEPDQGQWTFDGTSIEGDAALQGGPARHGAHLPTHQGAGPPHRDREHAPRCDRPDRRAALRGGLEVRLAPPGARHHRAGRRPAGAVHARSHARRVRREPVGRSAKAPRDVASADDRPEADHARRADGRCEPGAQAEPARAHQVVEGRGAHGAVRRARHGHGPRDQRLGAGDGAGPSDRRGYGGPDLGRSGRDRRLPGGPPRRRHRRHGRAGGDEGDGPRRRDTRRGRVGAIARRGSRSLE